MDTQLGIFSIHFLIKASFLLFCHEEGCEEAGLTIAAFSSVSHLFKEEPTS